MATRTTKHYQSAVIVLSSYPLREKQIRVKITERQKELGRRTTIDEDLKYYEAIPDSRELHPVRVAVYENPFARIPLSRDLFSGQFDELWGSDGEFLRRIYVGDEVGKLEEILGER